MRALSFTNPLDVRLVDAAVPDPGAGEALVRIEASAICGSELHAGGVIENPGHEAAGIVEHAPEKSGFRPGERVGISAVTGCGACEYCLGGVQLYCKSDLRVHMAMHADYVTVPVAALRRMPDGIPPAHAVLISGDALGVPARGLRRVPSPPGDRILVVGLGPVGLGHTLVRSYQGAEVIAIEPSQYRRDLGLKLGASQVLEPGADIGRAPGIVIESTGLPECIRYALDTVAPGGTVLQSGECEVFIQVSPSEDFIRREITYTGAWYYADEDFPEMVRLYEDGLPVGDMLTDELPAEDISEAYRRFVSKETGKVVLRWS